LLRVRNLSYGQASPLLSKTAINTILPHCNRHLIGFVISS